MANSQDSVAFISDLHGNLVALDAVLAALGRDGVERVVCLGDIVDLGPEPEACVRRLIERGIPCIHGNHDPLDEAKGPPLLAVQEWTAAQLSADSRRWLDALPASLVVDVGGARVACAHGSPRLVTEGLLATTPNDELDARLAPAEPWDVVVAGHTHVQLLRRRGHRTVVNAGSVGMPFLDPFSGAPPKLLRWAEYAVIRSLKGALRVELCRTSYDFAAFAASFDASFPGREMWLRQWID